MKADPADIGPEATPESASVCRTDARKILAPTMTCGAGARH
jgi:hypothetical protein